MTTEGSELADVLDPSFRWDDIELEAAALTLTTPESRRS